MRGAALRIGGDEYPLTEVTVSAHDSEEDDEHFLMVNLFADTEDLSKAGFAINSITFRGLREIQELQGLSMYQVLACGCGRPFSSKLRSCGSGLPDSGMVLREDKIGAQPSRKSLAACSSGSSSWTSVSLTMPS